MRVFSYGGGVQSTAALVLAVQREIDFPTFLFSNTGDDSENPETLSYVREIATPYAAEHGITVDEVHRIKRDGSAPTLLEDLSRPESRSVNIPMYLSPSGAPGTRNCTGEWKIKVIARWLRKHGATPDNPAITGLGISIDEAHRARSNSGFAFQTLTYPLIDLRLTRRECTNIIHRAGLPIPEKSSCTYCPFHTRAYWRRQFRDKPEIFAKSVAVERMLCARSVALGRGEAYLTSALIPLDQVVVDTGQLELDLESLGMCESGYCHT